MFKSNNNIFLKNIASGLRGPYQTRKAPVQSPILVKKINFNPTIQPVPVQCGHVRTPAF